MIRHITACLVSAFCKEAAGGSPTGVVLQADGLSAALMQHIAGMLPASHTAFVVEPGGTDPVRLRFFTAAGEIVNCGHGTVAAHYARALKYHWQADRTFFQDTKGGMQEVSVLVRGAATEVYLRQNPISLFDVPEPVVRDLYMALRLAPGDLSDMLPVASASPGVLRFLVPVRSPEVLQGVKPDFKALKDICSCSGNMGAFIYVLGDMAHGETMARMFAPSIGVDEDIINGNSSGCLGAFLLREWNRENLALKVSQGHAGQAGEVLVKASISGAETEVIIGGSARMMREIVLPVYEQASP